MRTGRKVWLITSASLIAAITGTSLANQSSVQSQTQSQTQSASTATQEPSPYSAKPSPTRTNPPTTQPSPATATTAPASTHSNDPAPAADPATIEACRKASLALARTAETNPETASPIEIVLARNEILLLSYEASLTGLRAKNPQVRKAADDLATMARSDSRTGEWHSATQLISLAKVCDSQHS